MQRDHRQDSLYLLTGLAIVALGAAYLAGGQKGRSVLQGIQGVVEQGQRRLRELQEALEKSQQLFERGRALLEETRAVASQGWRIVRAG